MEGEEEKSCWTWQVMMINGRISYSSHLFITPTLMAVGTRGSPDTLWFSLRDAAGGACLRFNARGKDARQGKQEEKKDPVKNGDLSKEEESVFDGLRLQTGQISFFFFNSWMRIEFFRGREGEASLWETMCQTPGSFTYSVYTLIIFSCLNVRYGKVCDII